MKYLKLGQYFEFGFNTQRFDTGAATDADALPTFRVYEENNDAVVNQQNCAKRDDANTTGYYVARGHVTAAVGTGTGEFDYEVGKTYEVRVAATVNSVAGAAVVGRFAVLADNVWDSLFGGTDYLQGDAVQIGGVTQTGRDLGALVATGTVNARTSEADFTLTSTDLSANNDDYNDMWLVFTAGNNKFIPRLIQDYVGATKQVLFTGTGLKGAFPRTVAPGDAFQILAGGM